jgi:hypothetical protein
MLLHLEKLLVNSKISELNENKCTSKLSSKRERIKG